MKLFMLIKEAWKYADGTFGPIPTFTFYPDTEEMTVTGVAGTDMWYYTRSTMFCASHRTTGLAAYKGKRFTITVDEQREIYCQLKHLGWYDPAKLASELAQRLCQADSCAYAVEMGEQYKANLATSTVTLSSGDSLPSIIHTCKECEKGVLSNYDPESEYRDVKPL